MKDKAKHALNRERESQTIPAPPDVEYLVAGLQRQYAKEVRAANVEAARRAVKGSLDEMVRTAWVGTTASNRWAKNLAEGQLKVS